MSTAAPDISESWIDPIIDAVVSDVQMSGYFDKVMQHEPKSKPGTGLTAALWCDHIEPLGEQSGLSVTSGRLLFIIQIYQNMLAEPQDDIDPMMMKAVSNLFRRWHDNFDFDLDPVVSHVDVFGMYGEKMKAQAGYVEIDDTLQRVYVIRLPLICNDIWPQIP